MPAHHPAQDPYEDRHVEGPSEKSFDWAAWWVLLIGSICIIAAYAWWWYRG